MGAHDDHARDGVPRHDAPDGVHFLSTELRQGRRNTSVVASQQWRIRCLDNRARARGVATGRLDHQQCRRPRVRHHDGLRGSGRGLGGTRDLAEPGEQHPDELFDHYLLHRRPVDGSGFRADDGEGRRWANGNLVGDREIRGTDPDDLRAARSRLTGPTCTSSPAADAPRIGSVGHWSVLLITAIGSCSAPAATHRAISC
jgi:hypothetical protein